MFMVAKNVCVCVCVDHVHGSQVVTSELIALLFSRRGSPRIRIIAHDGGCHNSSNVNFLSYMFNVHDADCGLMTIDLLTVMRRQQTDENNYLYHVAENSP